MSDALGLPVYTGPSDTLQYGFHHLESQMMAPHPIQGVEKRAADTDLNAKIDRVRRSYGIHMAMRLATEESVFGRPRRLPGLSSSKALYDTITGNGTKIEFSDFLDDPLSRPTAPPVSFHRQTEIKHGL